MAKLDNEEIKAYKEVLNFAYKYTKNTDLTFFDVRQIVTETLSFCNVNSISDLKDNETKDAIIDILKHQFLQIILY